MRRFLQANELFLAKPLNIPSRLLLIVGAACLAASFFFPLWRMTLVAPQYRDGLDLHIYSHQLVGGRDGQDLREINILNHYIGMRKIDEADFVEMRWIPFALGLFILLSLRSVVFGRMGNVIDLFALFSYFGLFSMANFYYRLYTYGTVLDPRAPMTIEPFVPVIIGKNRIANFTQYSYPQLGSYLLLGFALCLILAMFLSRKEPLVVPPASS
jgi:copper chaperone NosL